MPKYRIQVHVPMCTSHEHLGRFVRAGRPHKARLEASATGEWIAVVDVSAGGQAEAIATAVILFDSSRLPLEQIVVRADADRDQTHVRLGAGP